MMTYLMTYDFKAVNSGIDFESKKNKDLRQKAPELLSACLCMSVPIVTSYFIDIH